MISKENNEKLVKVWKWDLPDGNIIKVATVENIIKKEVPCKKIRCTHCCQGSLLPILNEKELKERKFKFQFVEAPEWLIKQVPQAQYLAVLKMNSDGECIYFDKKMNMCIVYPNCPASCSSYDCREDERMKEIWETGELKEEIVITEEVKWQ